MKHWVYLHCLETPVINYNIDIVEDYIDDPQAVSLTQELPILLHILMPLMNQAIKYVFNPATEVNVEEYSYLCSTYFRNRK